MTILNRYFFPILFLAAISLSSFTLQASDEGDFDIAKQSFQELFNNYRVGQPKITPWVSTYFTYGDNGTAVKLDSDGNPSSSGTSPMSAYDFLANLKGDTSAEAWEIENHTCDHLKGEDKTGCIKWWGHCNGWSGAAIKEAEPREPITVDGRQFSVADQKGILTELWLSTNSLNVGDTDKEKETGAWVKNPKDSSYDAYWDVTPRTFFLVFTNYIGILKTGIAIDRFTGGEVWNQPVIGYRHLPIRKEDISEINKNGKSLWSVLVRTKFYWANDDGIPHGKVSTKINIEKDTSDSEAAESSWQLPGENEYAGRLLSYKLFLDAPVTVDNSGTKISTTGKIVGDGIWLHQEEVDKHSYSSLDNTHPDFIWMPTSPYHDIAGDYGNPFVTLAVASKIRKGEDSSLTTKVKVGNVTTYALEVALDDLNLKSGESAEPKTISQKIRKLFLRDRIRVSIKSSDISINGNTATLKIIFPEGQQIDQLKEFLKDAELKATIRDINK